MGDAVATAERGAAGESAPPTVGAFLDEWLETIRPRLRPTTHAGYERALERIKRFLGSTPLQALTPLDVEAMYAQLAASGHANGTALAPKTIRHTHAVLHRALADAERLGLVVRNAAAPARPPAAVVAERRTWDAAQLRRFLELIRGERLETALMLAATTGIRRGEVLGLRWRDVDFDDRSLSVTQTITTAHNDIVVGERKPRPVAAPSPSTATRSPASTLTATARPRNTNRPAPSGMSLTTWCWDRAGSCRCCGRGHPVATRCGEHQEADWNSGHCPPGPGAVDPSAGATEGSRRGRWGILAAPSLVELTPRPARPSR